jgi:hypothetical protein
MENSLVSLGVYRPGCRLVGSRADASAQAYQQILKNEDDFYNGIGPW